MKKKKYGLECDSRCEYFHLKCGGVTKKEADVRKSNNCLEISCAKRIERTEIIMSNKVTIIFQFVHKIDLGTQQQQQQLMNKEIEEMLRKNNGIH